MVPVACRERERDRGGLEEKNRARLVGLCFWLGRKLENIPAGEDSNINFRHLSKFKKNLIRSVESSRYGPCLCFTGSKH